MKRLERILTGGALALGVPLLTFVAGWWGAVAVHLYVTTLSENVIRGAALVGLGAGLVLDLLFLKRWLAAFYTAPWSWVGGVYLGLFTLALAFCMGMPLGTFLVGIAGGVYLGRRLRHGQVEDGTASRTLNRGALVVSACTALAALGFGLAALREPLVLRTAAALGLDEEIVASPAGPTMIILLCLTLFILQFCSTLAAGRFARRHR